MTRDAAALVVGIDRYDDPNIPLLSGGVHDAVLAVGWLLAIGLDPRRIQVHASPAPEGGIHGLTCGAADGDALLDSFEAVSKDGGDQLFVFMSGHGLYVPQPKGGPTFLARDFGDRKSRLIKNLRMEGLIQWMLSWPFRERFLFYDACQNPSASVGRVSLVEGFDPPGLKALPVAPNGRLLACYSASPGQRAWAGAGEGVLVRHVVGQLDPAALAAMPADAEQQDAVLYDWTTGARRLDLLPLFQRIVVPAITAEAAQAGVAQNPIWQPFGGAADAFPILDLPPEPSSDLSIQLRPPEAAQAVAGLKLSIFLPSRGIDLPRAGTALGNPLVCKGPTAAELTVQCRVRPGTTWRALNPRQRAIFGGDPPILVFDFEDGVPTPPAGPSAVFNLRVGGPDGAPAHAMTGDDYAAIAASGDVPPPTTAGLTVERHEFGPDIGFDIAAAALVRDAAPNPAAATAAAHAWLGAMRHRLSNRGLTVTLFPPGVDPDGRVPNIRFGGAGSDLAGFLADLPVLRLTAPGEATPVLERSLAQIGRHPLEWAEAGTYRLTIDLPWGRWSRLVAIPDTGKPLSCDLPGTIGREPLRNAWLRSMGAKDPPPLDAETARRMAPSLARAMLLTARTGDGDERIEPFSRTALPEWDLLFSAGRLGEVDAAATRRIVATPSLCPPGPEREMLLLGLGHAALARGDFETLRMVLAAMAGSSGRSLDHVLLGHRLRTYDGATTAAVQAANIMRHVRAFDDQVAVPVLLGWSAGLLGPIFAKAKAEPPDWLTGLSQRSLIAVRTRADAARVEARRRAARSRAGDQGGGAIRSRAVAPEVGSAVETGPGVAINWGRIGSPQEGEATEAKPVPRARTMEE